MLALGTKIEHSDVLVLFSLPERKHQKAECWLDSADILCKMEGIK